MGFARFQKTCMVMLVVYAAAASLAPAQQPADSTDADAAPVKRAAAPDAAAAAAAEKMLKDIFAADYRSTAPAGKQILAAKLLAEARRPGVGPAELYVLLREARELASAAGDLELCLRAIDEMEERFEGDLEALRLQAIAAAVRPKATAATLELAARKALELVDEAVAAEDFDAAGRHMALAQRAAAGLRGDAATMVQQRAAALRAAQQEHTRIKAALEALAQNPDNPAMNAIIGKHYCFTKGDWEQGVRHLAKGDDPLLKAAAAADLQRPRQADAQKEVGDLWWDAAQKQSGTTKSALLRRAGSWYAQARPEMSGLAKSVVEKRLQESGFVSRVEVKDPQAKAAIAKAVAYLYSQQDEAGTWESMAPRTGGRLGSSTALAVYALACAGEDPQKNPKLRQGVEFLKQVPMEQVSTLSLRIQAWSALPEPALYRAAMQSDYKMLSAAATRSGSFAPSLKPPKSASGDIECTYDGWLGIHAAQQAQIPAPASVWKTLAQTLVKWQAPDGSFAAKPSGQGTNLARSACGITVALIARDRLTDAATKAAMEKTIALGLEHLNKQYTGKSTKGFDTTLLPVQRVGLLTGRAEFGGFNWYKEGSERVMRSAKSDGSFGSFIETCEGLIFLARGGP